MSPSSDGLLIVAALAGVFFILGIVIVSSVLVASKGRRLEWRKVLMGGSSLAFGLPVVVFLTLMVWRTTREAPQNVAVQRSLPQAPTLPSPSPVDKTDDAATTQVVVQAEAPPEQTGATPSVVPKEPNPDWVTAGEIRSEGTGKRLLVVSSERFATLEEADANVMNISRSEIKNDFRNVYDIPVSPPVGEFEIQKAYLRRHVEQMTVRTGTSEFPMYRVHRQLEISPELRQTLHRRRREQTGNGQLQSLATIAGFITMILGTLAVYFRLDTRTGSAYRGRLRVAALCVIMAGGILAMRLIAA